MSLQQAQELKDVVLGLSNALDLISPTLVGHHKRVAYIGWSISSELGLPLEHQIEIALAGAIHDIGDFSPKERLELLRFETEDSCSAPGRNAAPRSSS